jgi:hypothetical protein
LHVIGTGLNELLANELKALSLAVFGIGLIPAVPGRFFIRFAHKKKIMFGSFFLWRRSRAGVVFNKLAANFGYFAF